MMKIIHRQDKLENYIEKLQLEPLLPLPVIAQMQICLFEKGAYLCKEDSNYKILEMGQLENLAGDVYQIYPALTDTKTPT